ncbi:MAG: hypothetical protein KF893_09150 [Caldilineaceae bacterium]|nr:hypothetical protein [Caldilineaceae bacterium]
MAETIVRKELREAFLEQGIQDINFFNGRLLTAGDLVTLQDAARRRDHQLGQAAGEGIVSGLEARLVADGSDGNPPVVAVSKGLAVNRLGQTVALAQDVEVKLAKEKPERSINGGLFQYCLPPQENGKPIPGKGAYLLVARPITEYKGLAPRRGLGQDARVEGCDRDLLQEGAQFRLVSMDVTTLAKLSVATRQELAQLLQSADAGGTAGTRTRNKLRNWLAHVCFGTEELSAWPRDPLARVAGEFFTAAVHSPLATYGAVDALRDQGLIDDCDVPLALILWTATGVKWVDRWAVRRRLRQRPITRRFPLLASDQLTAEMEALMQQFQEQVQEMQINLSLGLANFNAGEHFKYLPPAGLLPLAGSGGARGFNYDAFFVGMTTRQPIFIEGAQLRSLLREALDYPPIDTTGEVVVWLYIVRENAQASLSSAPLSSAPLSSAPPPQGYMVFASGHMPYRGEARYDVNRWDFGNFS